MKRSGKLPVYRHYRALFELGSFCGRSDGELLARFLSRDGDAAELAFAVLLERHAAAVLRICRAIAGNESDAEDAFQATFLVLATRGDRLIVRDTLGPWLACVARRISRRARAAARARLARETRAARLAGSRETAAADGDGHDLDSVLHEEIDRLPERYRLPIVLCDLESQSHQEAARRLGWPVGTVKSRQARARQRLRARLTRRGVCGALPAVGAFRTALASVPDSLIQATVKAAAGLVSRGAAAEAVSASVSSLVTRFLRGMIMTRLSMFAVALLTVSVGVAATVMAQNTPQPGKPAGMSAEMSPAPRRPPAGAIIPVFEYEIQIAKDGVPVTDMTKVRIPAGQAAQLETPAGTFEVRFEPRLEPPAADKHSSNGGLDPRQLATLTAALESQPLLLRELQGGERDRLLAALRAPPECTTVVGRSDRVLERSGTSEAVPRPPAALGLFSTCGNERRPRKATG